MKKILLMIVPLMALIGCSYDDTDIQKRLDDLDGQLTELQALVKALKERAGAHGRSAEAEHREILAEALARPRKRSFAEVLASIPDVGTDADFERVESAGKAPRVFG